MRMVHYRIPAGGVSPGGIQQKGPLRGRVAVRSDGNAGVFPTRPGAEEIYDERG